MSNYKYTLEEINGKQYIRGWSVINEPSDFITIFPNKPDMPNGRQDEYGNYQYRSVSNPDFGKLIDVGVEEPQEDTRQYICVFDPIDPDPQKVENKIQETLAKEGKQFILRDEDGDVRWRIVINEEAKLQIERDPIDKPHIGEWLLNGQLGNPKLEEGELYMKVDGKVKGITIQELKRLIDEE